jgi:hypothetical protein
VWRDVNNIVITDNRLEEVYISHEQRAAWAGWLMQGKNLTKAKCCKDLGIKKSTGYSWLSGKQISGNMVTLALGSDNHDLWQDIFSAVDDKRLSWLLARKYPGEDVEKILDINFNSAGWGDFSHKAIRKLLPLLKQGKRLKEAILDMYGVVDMAADVSLRNIVVEQHYDSYKSLLKKIKGMYPVTVTAIEISHLLKAGNKSRKEIARNGRLEKKADKSLTDYQRHLLKLWEEFKHKSPYEPSKEITRDELFADYNIDHIVPKSKIFEHGIVNQCLCRKDLNEKKGCLTGIEFAMQLGIEEEYRKLIDNTQLQEKKKRFLLMDSSTIPGDYLDAGSDYITRCFARDADFVIPNKIINKYYRDWGLDEYPDNDCRSTLMKCLVLANFDRSTVDYFNNLKEMSNTSVGRYQLTRELFTSADVIPYVPRIKFYRKTRFGFIPRHQLHEESILGRRVERKRDARGNLVEKVFFKIRKPVASLTPAMVDKVLDKSLAAKIKARFKDREHADVIAELAGNPIFHDGKAVKSVSIRINGNELIKLNRGYCYSSMNHRYEPVTRRVVKLHDYINNLNLKLMYSSKGLKKHDIVEYDGNYYFLIGANADPVLRSVFELDAVGFQASRKMLGQCKLVRVNELGVSREERI